MRRFFFLAVALCSLAQPARAQKGRLLTLDEALRSARANHPLLQVAHAQAQVSDARADESLAPLLPQVSGTARYQRTTFNYVPSPGSAGMFSRSLSS